MKGESGDPLIVITVVNSTSLHNDGELGMRVPFPVKIIRSISTSFSSSPSYHAALGGPFALTILTSEYSIALGAIDMISLETFITRTRVFEELFAAVDSRIGSSDKKSKCGAR